MPQLNEPKIERLYLPSTNDKTGDDAAWVDFDVSKTSAGSYLGIDGAYENDRVAIVLQSLVNRIVDWNFVYATGEKVPITFDTVKKLDAADYKFLVEKIPADKTSLTNEEKKTSSDT